MTIEKKIKAFALLLTLGFSAGLYAADATELRAQERLQSRSQLRTLSTDDATAAGSALRNRVQSMSGGERALFQDMNPGDRRDERSSRPQRGERGRSGENGADRGRESRRHDAVGYTGAHGRGGSGQGRGRH